MKCKFFLCIPFLAAPVLLSAQSTAKKTTKASSTTATQTNKQENKGKASEFTITGKIGTLNAPARIYLDYSFKDKMFNDSADLVNGTFSFHGPMDGTATSRITLTRDGKGRDYEIYAKGDGDIVYIDFGSDNMTITSADSLHNAVIKGSKTYDERIAYEKATGLTIMETNRIANQRWSALTPEQQKDTSSIKVIDTWVRKIRSERKDKLMTYAKTHKDSRYSLQALKELMQVYAVADEEAEGVFNNMNAAVKASYDGQQFSNGLKARRAAVAGKKARNFTQANVQGKQVSLSDYKGKWVLLEFWASWCSPCRQEIPNLKKQYELYSGKGFNILSVSADSDRKKWLDALDKEKMSWEQVSDLKGWNNEVVKLYAISGVPANFLINPQGDIVAVNLVGEKLNSKLEEVFAK